MTGFYNIKKAFSKVNDLNTISMVVLCLLVAAMATGMASMFVEYAPGSQIRDGEKCIGMSKMVDPRASEEEVDLCALNVAMPSLAFAFGAITLIFIIGGVSIFEFMPFRGINSYVNSVFPMFEDLNLTACISILLAFVFSAVAMGIQLGTVNIEWGCNGLVLNGSEVGEKTPGYILSLVSLVLYLCIVFVVYSKYFTGDLAAVNLACWATGYKQLR